MASERYRRVTIRMWGDERFQKLSPPKPNAQTLWQFLITGPFTTAIPGVVLAGHAAMAERLRWPLAAYLRCWTEVEALQMATYDASGLLYWLPRAIAHNEPESLNVVKAWRRAFNELPECRVKANIERALRAYLEGQGQEWWDAFVVGPHKATVKPKMKATAKPSAKARAIQIQDQEQYVRTKNGAADAAPSQVAVCGNVENSEPAPNVRVIGAVIRKEGLLEQHHAEPDVTEADLVEAVKTRCAKLQVPYDSTTVHRALDSEQVKRDRALRRGG